MNKLTTLTLLTIAFTYPAVFAQESSGGKDENGNHISFVKTSQDTTVYNILEKDRSKNQNEIPVPHFAIHTANNKFVMTIGAKINPIIGVDMGCALYQQEDAGINFVPNAIPIKAPSGQHNDFFLNALDASIDIQVVGFGGTANQITGYLKISTNGNDKNISLSKAYLTWRGLTAGLKHSLFQDEEVYPPTIDPQGPNGLVGGTVNEIGYISPAVKGFTFGAGLDMPTYYSSTGHYWGNDYDTWHNHLITGEVVVNPEYYSMKVPDIPMFVQWTDNKYARIKLAAIIRNKFYRDLLSETRKSCTGWGLSLSSNIMPADPIIIYLQATYGKGIGAYIQDLAGVPLSYNPDDRHPGELSPAPMLGWCAGLTYNINNRWQVNAMASQAKLWDVENYAEHQAEEGNINNYKYGLYTAANVFYNISSYFQVGLEYVYGYRKSWNAGSGHDNRLQFQIQFTL